ncbi:MAG TPA: tRNA (adenosine(37)-N6)-threonylcarbamoyltransferase complex transferase subunit TsaD [Nitrososphaera sp.]|nr:tRNA (adenosine(37)-N6)-threonylcarbamoyltransferase complex transferase subunit TsaD [Nitrososphaera sp.]
MLQREPELLEQLSAFLQQYDAPDIDCIAVTHGPGLEPALWVGVNFAKALSAAWSVPIVAVNHMEGHIALSMMKEDNLASVEFPLLALLISGGHTELVVSESWMKYKLIGQTRDDAAGEAFDKVARLLDLPYPGGPEISKLAEKCRSSEQGEALLHKGSLTSLILPRPMLHENNYDFSFSGLKTAVRKIIEQTRQQGPTLYPPAQLQGRTLSEDERMLIAREFEDAVSEVLVTKTVKAIEEYGIQTVVVGGGVSANKHIRAELAKKLERESCMLLVPPPELATDNALMIALAGYFRAVQKEFVDPQNLSAKGNLKLA